MKIARWLPRFREAARALDELAEHENWSRDQILSHQLDRLNGLWAHARAHVPYYRTLIETHDIPERFSSVEEFSATVPVLPKSVIRTESHKLHSSAGAPGSWKYTGGSTGQPTPVYWSDDAHRLALWAKYRFYQSWGVDTFDKAAWLWGHGASYAPGWKGSLSRLRQPVIDRLRNRMRMNAKDLRPESLRNYLDQIRSYNPKMVYAYSRALYMMAMEAERGGVDFRCEALKVVVATSEPCWPHMVEAIERNLHAPVAREYGAMECGILATDSPIDKTLRIREDQVLIETQEREDGYFDLIVTVLNNPSFPMIRYAIGDMTDRPITRPAKGFSILAGVAGRNNDLLRSKNGEYLHWLHVETAIYLTVNPIARRYSIHQRKDGSLNIEVELSDPQNATAAQPNLDALRAYFVEHLGGYPVELRVVEQCQQTAAGKQPVVRSELYDLNTAAPATSSPASHRTPVSSTV